MQFLGFAVLICLFQIFDFSFACKGYDIQLINVVSGTNNPTLVIQPNPKISLTKDCKLRFDGCIEILKPVSRAHISFQAKKKGLLTVVDVKDQDLCDFLEVSKYKHRCPFEKRKYCDSLESEIDVSPFTKYLAKLIGSIIVDVSIVTNEILQEVNTFTLELKVDAKLDALNIL